MPKNRINRDLSSGPLRRTFFATTLALIGSTACVEPNPDAPMCGELWRVNTQGASGSQATGFVRDIKRDDKWVYAELCLTPAQAVEALDPQSAVSTSLRASALAECKTAAVLELSLISEDCEDHLSAPYQFGSCAIDYLECSFGTTESESGGGSSSGESETSGGATTFGGEGDIGLP